jgi:hypothetical protein
MKALCSGKCFQCLIKEKSGLTKNEEIPEKLISSNLRGKTVTLDDDDMIM